MKPKTLRFAVLIPIFIGCLSLLKPLFSSDAAISQLFMSGSTIYGLASLCLVWFVFLSGVRYSRAIMLIDGGIALALTTAVLAGHFLNFTFPLEHLVLPPPNTPFLLNLTYMFMACYLIQLLVCWLPRTKFLVNGALAVILFMVLLSTFGHIYQLEGVKQEALLLPMPLGAIISFLALGLVIFAYTNHMDRLYLNPRIMSGFALMLVAVIGANVVVYRNLTHTTTMVNRVDGARSVLSEIYSLELYLTSAESDTQTYVHGGNPKYLTSYASNKQAYRQAMDQIAAHADTADTPDLHASVLTVSNLGNQILGLTDTTLAQAEQKKLSARTQTDSQNQLDLYMQQMLDEIRTVSTNYTSQLNQLVAQESYGARGIVLGVSITSALSLLMIIFTPLFIRQTIQKLSTAQEGLRTSNRLLGAEKSRAEAILTSVGDGLFAVDAHQKIILFNHAAEALTGLKKATVLDTPYRQQLKFTSPTAAAAVDFTAKALEGIESHLTHNLQLVRQNGQKVDVQVSASPVKDKNGVTEGAIVVFRDRSDEQALENAKDDFVSLASHQLRTPATATKQFLAMFLQGYAGPIDDKQRLFLQQAYDNNELGINIIEELLDITRLESNKFKLVKEKIDLNHFLQQSAEQHKAYADKGRQRIALVAPKKSVHIEADANLLGMAVDNLVTNALKYSPEGSTVTIRLKGGDQPSIAIEDAGIGIKEEDMQKIFERFTRLEDPQKQHVSGTGIGLYLVQKIASMLHAKITLQSDYGKGSTFTLIFKPTE